MDRLYLSRASIYIATWRGQGWIEHPREREKLHGNSESPTLFCARVHAFVCVRVYEADTLGFVHNNERRASNVWVPDACYACLAKPAIINLSRSEDFPVNRRNVDFVVCRRGILLEWCEDSVFDSDTMYGKNVDVGILIILIICNNVLQ